MGDIRSGSNVQTKYTSRKSPAISARQSIFFIVNVPLRSFDESGPQPDRGQIAVGDGRDRAIGKFDILRTVGESGIADADHAGVRVIEDLSGRGKVDAPHAARQTQRSL